jgi:2-polyprenyl-3-methyl-5-hydroxy-6-metoxy-1,4-benzoquinol methylase
MNRFESQKEYLSGDSCPICGCMKTVHAWTATDLNWKTQGSFPYIRCKGCGAFFRPVGSTISADAYPQGYGTYGNPESPFIQSRINSTANHRRAEFLESIRKPGTILDVGCGSGFFLAHLRSRGWQVHGLEPAVEHVAFARNVLGLPNVIQGTWPPAKGFSRQFDAVTMIHLIEHMPDPMTALTAARYSLCERGTVLLETPNSESWPARIFGPRWVTLDAPRHMVIFSPKSLAQCLKAAEFGKIRTITYSPSTMEWSESLRHMLNQKRLKDRRSALPAVSVPYLTRDARSDNRLRQQILKPVHTAESLLYRSINKFADTKGQGCNILAAAFSRPE